jgi:chemotaxis signal transduction protein
MERLNMDLNNDVIEYNENENNLWLTVSLSDQKYAVNCDYVDSIFQLQQEITELPDAGREIVGVINLRGIMLPLVDMRQLFGLETLEEELSAFEAMLRSYQQAHIEWVRELKSCLEEEREFLLPTDPHACAFGRWYDAYKSDSQMVSATLAKIDGPHKRLHESAEKCFSLKSQGLDWDSLQKVLSEEVQPYSEQIVALLETTIADYRGSFRKICVAISNGSSKIGMITDNVHTVGRLEKEYPLDKLNRSRYIHSLGDLSDGNRALLIDEKQLLTLVD